MVCDQRIAIPFDARGGALICSPGDNTADGNCKAWQPQKQALQRLTSRGRALVRRQRVATGLPGRTPCAGAAGYASRPGMQRKRKALLSACAAGKPPRPRPPGEKPADADRTVNELLAGPGQKAPHEIPIQGPAGDFRSAGAAEARRVPRRGKRQSAWQPRAESKSSAYAKAE